MMPSAPEPITSAHNPRLKLVRRIASRSGRMREGAFAVEGEDLVVAGVHAGWEPRFVLCNEQNPPAADFFRDLDGRDVLYVPAELLEAVVGLAHPPRVIAVFDLPERVEWARSADAAGTPTIYLDGLRDPGNVGTVVRTASAFGVRRVLLGPTTADPFSPKATRASMGAIFSVECLHVEGIDDVVPGDAMVIGLDAAAGVQLHEARLGTAPVLCIGGEREGVSPGVLARADLLVAIPQRAEVDSLNASTAASIVLYEWQRQQIVGGR